MLRCTHCSAHTFSSTFRGRTKVFSEPSARAKAAKALELLCALPDRQSNNFHVANSDNSTTSKLAEAAIMATTQGAISKRRKFVADGVFYAELNEFFQRELAEEGYSGVEVRVTPTVTDISTLDTLPAAGPLCSSVSSFSDHL